jgi:hypothetical protein
MFSIRALLIPLIACVYCSSEAIADEPQRVADQYRYNYEFSLRYQSADGESTAIEFVVSAGAFEVSSHLPLLVFSGSILGAENDAVVLQYKLRTERRVVVGELSAGSNQTSVINTRQAGVSSNMRITLGSPMTIYSVGKERVSLHVTKVQ